MIRFGGRDSYAIKEELLRKDFAAARYNPPNPRYLSEGSIAFTDNPEVYAVFDKTYRPWRSLLAKSELVDLMMNNDPRRAFALSELPEALQNELVLRLELTNAAYVSNSNTCFTFSPRLDTKIHLKDSTIDFQQSPNVEETPETVAARKKLIAHPMYFSEDHAEAIGSRERMYAKIPIVLVFGPVDDGPVKFESRQRVALKLFEDWSPSENFRIDEKFYNFLGRTNVWPDSAAIFRCKVMSDLASIAPAVYQKFMNTLTKDYDNKGFSNEDAMREALTPAQTFSTTSFECTVGLNRMGKPAGFHTFAFP